MSKTVNLDDLNEVVLNDALQKLKQIHKRLDRIDHDLSRKISPIVQRKNSEELCRIQFDLDHVIKNDLIRLSQQKIDRSYDNATKRILQIQEKIHGKTISEKVERGEKNTGELSEFKKQFSKVCTLQNVAHLVGDAFLKDAKTEDDHELEGNSDVNSLEFMIHSLEYIVPKYTRLLAAHIPAIIGNALVRFNEALGTANELHQVREDIHLANIRIQNYKTSCHYFSGMPSLPFLQSTSTLDDDPFGLTDNKTPGSIPQETTSTRDHKMPTFLAPQSEDLLSFAINTPILSEPSNKPKLNDGNINDNGVCFFMTNMRS